MTMFKGCDECGCPGDLHNATCSRSIKDRNQEVADLRARVAELEGALTEIAMFRDDAANARLEDTGSYTAFDEPGSVEIARKALRSIVDRSGG